MSVVVPCYNYGHYLPDCVGTVLTQPGVDVQVIVIDDASPDGSGEVADRLAASDPRVRSIRHRTNRGHIATYNEGLEAAQGEFVSLLSADDLLTPGALGRATALMQSHPGVGLVYGHWITLEGDTPPPARTRARSWSVWNGTRWIASMCWTGRNNIASPETVLRTDLQRRIGGYRTDLPHSGDMEMWIRAAAVAGVGRVNGADQAYYRVHPASMFRTTYGAQLDDLRGRLDAFRVSFTEGPASGLEDRDALFAAARRSLARAALRHVLVTLDQPVADREPIEPYLAFATECDPGITSHRTWARASRPTGARPLTRFRSVTRDLDGRLRWRAYRWTGL